MGYQLGFIMPYGNANVELKQQKGTLQPDGGLQLAKSREPFLINEVADTETRGKR